jgi:hypothetical protein
VTNNERINIKLHSFTIFSIDMINSNKRIVESNAALAAVAIDLEIIFIL